MATGFAGRAARAGRLVALAVLAAASASAGPPPPPLAGRIEHPGGESACSAALLAPDLALTAGHCMGPESGPRPFRPPDGGAPVRTGAVQRHPVYGTWWSGARRWRYDLAVVALDPPVPGARQPALPVGPPPRAGETLWLETWRIDRPEPLRRPCPVTSVTEGLAMLACPVRSGHSGGPVLRLAEAGPEIVAVVVAQAGIGAVAAPLAPRIGALLEAAGRADGRP